MIFHKVVVCVALLGGVSIVSAAAPPNYGDVPAVLADIPAIRSWAERNSWGGNSVDVLKSGENEIALVQRSFTSGLLTNGLVVFVRIGRQWEAGLILRTVTGYTYKIVQDGDTVRLKNSASGVEVGSFSISTIARDYFAGAGKRDP
jgi:hypothetical protein